MKELTIEQKAKAYDKVREKITLRFGSNVIEEIFSEFEMSEDEKIRKQILSFLKEFEYDHYRCRSLKFSSWIAWLDKLGEKKPVKNIVETWKDMRLEVYQQASGNRHEPNYFDDTTKMFSLNDIDEIIEKMSEQMSSDEVESKFKVGAWIVFYGGKPFKILKVEQEQNGILNYLLLDQNGHDSYYNKKYVDENARLWTIQDAKDGDIIISFSNQPFIYNGKFNKTYVGGYCGFDVYGHFIIWKHIKRCNWTRNANIKPATKEQRDLLFQKMKEKGYEWDTERKVLYQDLKKLQEKEMKNIKQNHICSDKDKYIIECLIDYLKTELDTSVLDEDKKTFTEQIKLLKSIKDKFLSQPKQEWSDEDENNLSGIIMELVANKNKVPSHHIKIYNKYINWLLSIKGRIVKEVIK